VSKKRNPQTAAKRAREQAMREKREHKAAKKQARAAASAQPVIETPSDSDRQSSAPPITSGLPTPLSGKES
jgi:hypothetical protein